MVNLDPEIFLKRYPKELSGGQQQRVGVVRALAADPPVLLMDEPFGAIDPINREVIQDEFMKLQAALKKTVVFVSHDIDEAVKMGSRIAIFRDGRLIQYDTPNNVLAQPVDAFVADFVGSRPHAEAAAPDQGRGSDDAGSAARARRGHARDRGQADGGARPHLDRHGRAARPRPRRRAARRRAQGKRGLVAENHEPLPGDGRRRTRTCARRCR